jgi:hypothetical protein
MGAVEAAYNSDLSDLINNVLAGIFGYTAHPINHGPYTEHVGDMIIIGVFGAFFYWLCRRF